jgi:hypothetical protein
MYNNTDYNIRVYVIYNSKNRNCFNEKQFDRVKICQLFISDLIPVYANAEFCWTNSLHIYTKVTIYPNEILQYRAWNFRCVGTSAVIENLYFINYLCLVTVAIFDGVPTYRLQIIMWTIQGYGRSLLYLALYIMLQHHW